MHSMALVLRKSTQIVPFEEQFQHGSLPKLYNECGHERFL